MPFPRFYGALKCRAESILCSDLNFVGAGHATKWERETILTGGEKVEWITVEAMLLFETRFILTRDETGTEGDELR